MTSFFSSIIGGVFGTQVGQLIEKATDVGQVSEDWSLYMEICDHVNVSEDGPKDAIKAIKKQLVNNIGKNNVVILYTLTVLETCVKNCGRRFHIQVAQKDFLQELIRVISPKGNPPQVVIDKVLSLLQTWADAFQGCDDLKEVEKVCVELKEKGMEFPLSDLDRAAPIHTPVRSMPPLIEPSSPSRQPVEVARVIPGSEQTAAPGSLAVDSEKLGKLRSELDVVQQNCKVMGEMLTELTPGQEPLEDDWQLLTELNATCLQMQKRIVKLIQKVQSEDVTCELLRINDDLNNVLLRYERYERLRGSQKGQSTAAASSAPPVYATVQKGTVSSDKVAETGTLIDFGDLNPVQPSSTQPSDDFSKVATLSIRGNSTLKDTNPALPPADGPGNDEFDALAHSRQLHEQSHQMLRDGTADRKNDVPSELGTAVLPTNGTNPCASEIEVSEMEHWLNDTQGLTQQSATSSEFDQFLATHTATESDKHLDESASPSQANRGRRVLQDNGGDPDALFTL